MARPLRIELAGALYYVTSRGGGREASYVGDEARLVWLEVEKSWARVARAAIGLSTRASTGTGSTFLPYSWLDWEARPDLFASNFASNVPVRCTM